ncbi:MAG: HAD hydrolase family protein [Eggerthellaceae bacterium]
MISGDDPRTVSGIASLRWACQGPAYVDATTLADDAAIAEGHRALQRVRPREARAEEGVRRGPQEKGHIVAMTGDGVNDTLALKRADCSVAMAAGSDAARNVAQLVLVDNDFAAMPKVVAGGGAPSATCSARRRCSS